MSKRLILKQDGNGSDIRFAILDVTQKVGELIDTRLTIWQLMKKGHYGQSSEGISELRFSDVIPMWIFNVDADCAEILAFLFEDDENEARFLSDGWAIVDSDDIARGLAKTTRSQEADYSWTHLVIRDGNFCFAAGDESWFFETQVVTADVLSQVMYT